MTLAIVSGSRAERVLRLGLNRLPTYDSLRGTAGARLRAYADHLVDEGYLALTEWSARCCASRSAPATCSFGASG